jgi:hypothetical protein
MTGVHHHTQLLTIEMGSHELFAWDTPRTTILLILASQVVKIRGVGYWCPASAGFDLTHDLLNF